MGLVGARGEESDGGSREGKLNTKRAFSSLGRGAEGSEEQETMVRPAKLHHLSQDPHHTGLPDNPTDESATKM